MPPPPYLFTSSPPSSHHTHTHTHTHTQSHHCYLLHVAHSVRAVKLHSRNNLIVKLAGSSLGASTLGTLHTSALALCYSVASTLGTLHTSALALCYSVAEYCCPVQCVLDPAAQISSTPNFIVQCD